jgi:Spy/CpxP family protein refolding chaperone
MRTWTAVVIVLATTALAGAQHVHDGARGSEPHLEAQQCQTQFERVIADGRGFGLAFVADQEGYPGPLHVLELKDRLRLSADQTREMQRMMDDMYARSRPAAARLLAAEGRLRALFAAGTADAAAVRTAVADAERARADARLVHLLTHLETRDRLTDEQRRLYHAARWGH